MDKDGYYISYSPCGVFSEFVGENMTGYLPCIEATVSMPEIFKQVTFIGCSISVLQIQLKPCSGQRGQKKPTPL